MRQWTLLLRGVLPRPRCSRGQAPQCSTLAALSALPSLSPLSPISPIALTELIEILGPSFDFDLAIERINERINYQQP